MAEENMFFDYPDCKEEFSKCVMPGCAGKNLYVCLWWPELDSRTGRMSEEEIETFNAINPEYDHDLTVQITWGSGETEQISMMQRISHDKLER